jgi:hypothetical protein
MLFATDFIPVNTLPFRTMGGAINLDDWQWTLEWIHGMEWQTLVPGHGNLGNKDTVMQVHQYFTDLQNAVRVARASGHADESEAMVAAVRAELMPKYGAWGNFGTMLADNISGVIRIWGAQ